MAYEILQRDPESESELTRLMGDEIVVRGNDNLEDKYQPRADKGGIERRFGCEGSLGFGALWMTHHTKVGNHEVIYAYRPPVIYRSDESWKMLAELSGYEPPKDSEEPFSPKGELYIHTFKGSRIEARTQFSDYEGQVNKKRITNFGANFGSGLRELSRPINSEEEEALKLVIIAPESNVLALDGLTRLSPAEIKEARRARADYDRKMREHEETLADIADKVELILPLDR
jgi:hypothetical protein